MYAYQVNVKEERKVQSMHLNKYLYIIASFVLFKTLSLDKKTSLKNFIVLVLKTLLNRS